MKTLINSSDFQARTILVREEGQDLVEYALVVALIAFGAIAGMNYLSSSINVAFSQVATTLTSALA
jgi:pilus assembly protein Flp/PilA